MIKDIRIIIGIQLLLLALKIISECQFKTEMAKTFVHNAMEGFDK